MQAKFEYDCKENWSLITGRFSLALYSGRGQNPLQRRGTSLFQEDSEGGLGV